MLWSNPKIDCLCLHLFTKHRFERLIKQWAKRLRGCHKVPLAGVGLEGQKELKDKRSDLLPPYAIGCCHQAILGMVSTGPAGQMNKNSRARAHMPIKCGVCMDKHSKEHFLQTSIPQWSLKYWPGPGMHSYVQGLRQYSCKKWIAKILFRLHLPEIYCFYWYSDKETDLKTRD